MLRMYQTPCVADQMVDFIALHVGHRAGTAHRSVHLVRMMIGAFHHRLRRACESDWSTSFESTSNVSRVGFWLRR